MKQFARYKTDPVISILCKLVITVHICTLKQMLRFKRQSALLKGKLGTHCAKSVTNSTLSKHNHDGG